MTVFGFVVIFRRLSGDYVALQEPQQGDDDDPDGDDTPHEIKRSRSTGAKANDQAAKRTRGSASSGQSNSTSGAEDSKKKKTQEGNNLVDATLVAAPDGVVISATSDKEFDGEALKQNPVKIVESLPSFAATSASTPLELIWLERVARR